MRLTLLIDTKDATVQPLRHKGTKKGYELLNFIKKRRINT
jgi:hypothetical protein